MKQRLVVVLERRVDASGIVEVGKHVLGVEGTLRRLVNVENVARDELEREREVLGGERELQQVGVYARELTIVAPVRAWVVLHLRYGRVHNRQASFGFVDRAEFVRVKVTQLRVEVAGDTNLLVAYFTILI